MSQFQQRLTPAFFANILAPKKLQSKHFSFVIFGAKILYEKRAHKTLMKLTACLLTLT